MPLHARRAASLVAGLALITTGCAHSSSTTPSTGAHRAGGASRGHAPAAERVEAQLLPWRLPRPISRPVVLAQSGSLVLAGGLSAAQTSLASVFRLDPSSGALTPDGSLARPLHDAAGAVVGHASYVFGGGAATTVATVQRLAPGGTAAVSGALPQPRSDLVAAAVGGRAVVLGGYDGNTTTPTVLTTSDGSHFTTVAKLPVGVRYPAVAAVGDKVYLFGGEHAGSQTDVVQMVDVGKGTAQVVGHLPAPLSHASAGTLPGGVVAIAGGRTGSTTTSQVLVFHPATGQVAAQASLPKAVADAGSAVLDGSLWLVGGETPATVADVQKISLVPDTQPATTAHAAGAPFVGDLLIADRGNNRLLLVDVHKHVLWSYPAPGRPAPPGGFYFPDDAFFVHHGTAIVSNEEDNNAIVEIAYPSGRLLWSYGHPHVAGSAPGYLNQPDDAFLLRDGSVTVADAKNCRILFISPQGRPQGQLGSTGSCVHSPPRSIGYPNGDTPLSDGNLLISEINGSWITEMTPQGSLVWTLHLPISYPSDPQQLGPDRYLVADYARPGAIYEFDRTGRIYWSYHFSSGHGLLDHPSLAERLPSGDIAVNDDYRHRVVIIDPHTKQIVWEYGVDDTPGTSPGYLNTPDGFDLLLPDHSTPTHPQTA